MHPHEARHCARCAGLLAQDLETVPYVGPGPRVVELRHVLVLRCTGCTHMTMEVPEPRSLDTLIRCLAGEMSEPLPQLAYEQGRWCILPGREAKGRTKWLDAALRRRVAQFCKGPDRSTRLDCRNVR
jgi:hypothetical protein